MALTPKQKEVKDYLSTISNDDSAFIFYFFQKNQLLRNRFPEILSFEEYLKIFKPRVGEKRKIKILEDAKALAYKISVTNKDGYVMNVNVPEVLGISKEVYQKMYKAGNFIKPAGFEEFHKWGKDLKTPYFDFDKVIDFKNSSLLSVMKSTGLSNEETSKIEYAFVCKKIIDDVKVFYSNYQKMYKHLVEFNFNGKSMKLFFWFNAPISLKKYKLGSVDDFMEKVDKIIKSNEQKVLMFNKYLENREKSGDFVSDDLLNLDEIQELFKADKEFNEAKEIFDNAIITLIIKRESSRLDNIFNLKNYQNTFPRARMMKRNIQVLCGPTNSGKTYEAVEALSKAKSGAYLAPLRLMAMEIYDKLNAMGVPCSLVTGDEEIIVPGAKHISSTIEAINLNEHYNVAVIDEFQMLQDVSRGWAWTQAILGVCAENVFVIGNDVALDVTLKALSKTEDIVSVRELKRKSELKVEFKRVEHNGFKKGDAVIAFSKAAVLEWAAYIKNKGFSVSVIYGALAPDVRRKQANMFTTGETDILVATDAIGMGLNLPIDRVVFTNIEKYDGYQTRLLTHSEIKQIAGRAGRYENTGFVAAVKKDVTRKSFDYDEYGYYESSWKREKMNQCNYSLEVEARSINIISDSLSAENEKLTHLWIVPNNYHLTEIARALGTQNILDVLRCFKLTVSDSLYSAYFFDDIHTLASCFKEKELEGLDVILQYHLMKTPIDKKENLLSQIVNVIRSCFLKNQKISAVNIVEEYKHSGQEAAEDALKVITALVYLSKYSDLIDVTGINELREYFSGYLHRILVNKFYRSAKSKQDKIEKDRFKNENKVKLALERMEKEHLKIERKQKRLERKILKRKQKRLERKRLEALHNQSLIDS